jgi:S-adenosylhomocysteine hydrolase
MSTLLSGLPAQPTHTSKQDSISSEMPLLHLFSQHSRLAPRQPLRGVHVLSTLHALTNLRSTLLALERLGLEPEKTHLFYKNYPYPRKSDSLAWAVTRGYMVAPVEDLLRPETLTRIEATLPTDARLLIAEDGGHAFSAICKLRPSLISQIVGVVEQTTKGIRRINHAIDALGQELTLPVLSLPDSVVKRTIEPPHIARGVIRSIEAVLDESLGGRHQIAVLGCGVIGLEIARKLSSQGCRVRAYDPQPCTCGDADGHFQIVETAIQAVQDAEIIIGTSGELSINDKVINRLAHRALVVSASSDRVELDYDYITQLATEVTPFYHPAYHDAEGQPLRIGSTYRLAHNRHEITLVAEGLPLNFLGLGGMSDRVADVILTEIVVACALVAAGHYSGQSGLLRNAFNEIDAEFGISQRFFDFQRAK